MTAAPFAAEVANLVTGPHAVAVSVTATAAGHDPVTLEVVGGRLSWAESRSPRVRGSIRCALPDDLPALLEVLDPILRVRVAVTVAYTLPTGATDAQVVADLGLRSRTVSRPDAVVVLEVASDEALVIDSSPNAAVTAGGDPPATTTQPNGPAWIATVIREGLWNLEYPTGPDIIVTAPAEPIEWPTDVRDYWDAITDAADQLDVDVYDNGDRIFRIAPRPTTTSESVLTLRTGPGGTILSSDSGVDRAEWANYVALRYEWETSAGTRNTLYGTARVTDGPYSVAAVGYKNLTEVRQQGTTQYAANLAARAILARMLSRTRGLTLTAVAAWWVRPGHTVTVDLPLADQARHLVSWVDFDLEDMTMDLGTRLPDTASVIGE